MKNKINFPEFKIHFLLALCLVLLNSANLFAIEKVLTLGGKEGWPKLLKQDSITYGTGRFGWTSLELATNARKVTGEADMLFNFEGGSIYDTAGKYKVVENNLVLVADSAMGHKAALCRGRKSGLVLKGSEGSIFGTEGNPGSFVIEFWLKPSVAENGEFVFTWNSSRLLEDEVIYQQITAGFNNSRMEWSFANVFDGWTKDHGEIHLTSYSAVIPDKWAHHVLMFNEETGLLEYKIDGKTECLKYITVSGHERSTIFEPVLGQPNEITICGKYTGFIDDLRILKGIASGYSNSIKKTESLETIGSSRYDRYMVTGGRFETQPILTVPGAVIEKIDVIANVPAQTEIRYYIRTGDNFYGWNDTFPAWVEVTPGRKISGSTGRYFQIAAELFPDGGGRQSPSITKIDVTYNEPPLPIPPAKVKAVAGDGYVDLSWSYSIDDTTGGYYVYYGTRPGEYLGVVAVEGPSPVKVGNVSSYRLTGLKNGAIYYFAVAAYSVLDNRIIGNFSDEVFARPKKKAY